MQKNDIRTRSDFQQALLEDDSYEGVTGRISFDDKGEVEKTLCCLRSMVKNFMFCSNSK